MNRKLLGVLVLLTSAALASADPPSSERVLANAKLPPAGTGVLITTERVANGLVLPVPGLGFVPVPVAVWRCNVFQTAAGAPAGALPVRKLLHLLTLAE